MAEEDLARFLKCIGEPTRLQIIKMLSHGERCVGDLSTALQREQSLISHHLRHLKECNVVRDRQDAQKVFYTISDERIARLVFESEALMADVSLCMSCAETASEDK